MYPFPLPVPLDGVDATRVQDLLLELAPDCLAPVEAELFIRLALVLRDHAPWVLGLAEDAIDEDAIRGLADLLYPEIPGRPLSWHLLRRYHAEWLAKGRPLRVDLHRFVPDAGGFPLEGVIARREITVEQFRALQVELTSPGATAFWVENLAQMPFAIERSDAGFAIRCRVLETLIRSAREGVLSPEDAPRGALAWFAGLLENNPHSIASHLARVDAEAPRVLTWRPTPPDPEDASARGPAPVELSLANVFREELWPKEWETISLHRALARQPALREALADWLRVRGLSFLERLPEAERVAVLGLDARLLAAAFSGPRVAYPRWLAGNPELAPLLAELGAADLAARKTRVRARLALDLPGELDALDADLEALGREGTDLFAEVFENGRCRPVKEWLARHPTWAAWRVGVHGSARVRAAIMLDPRFARQIGAAHHPALQGLVAAGRWSLPHDASALAVAHAVVSGWERLPGLVPPQEQGPCDDDAHLLALAGTPEAVEAAVAAARHVARRDRQTIAETLRYTPWVPMAVFGAFTENVEDLREDEVFGLLGELLGDGPAPAGVARRLAGDATRLVAGTNLLVRLAEHVEKQTELPQVQSPEDRRLARVLAGLEAGAATGPVRMGLLLVARTTAPGTCEKVAALAARLLTPALPEPDLGALADSDLVEHAVALATRFVELWPGKDDARVRVLRAARLRVVARLAGALEKEGVDSAPVVAPLAGGVAILGRSRLAALRPDLPEEAWERVLDRAGDEVTPLLVRAALTALATRSQAGWAAGGSPASRLLDDVLGTPPRPAPDLRPLAEGFDLTPEPPPARALVGAWAEEPASLARVLHGLLAPGGALRAAVAAAPARRVGDGVEAWLRAALFALGKLREPLGGKVPNLFHALARDPALPPQLQIVVARQESVFDRKHLDIQLGKAPAARVREAVTSLHEGDRKATPPELVRRPAPAPSRRPLPDTI